MNLIQIQERLKDLPSSPQTMQALMAYANGANPTVPPYLALGELNRRKQMMEKAQQMQAQQAPQGTVKDQVAQSAGIMALQQGRQQQGMQQMMQGAGQQMGQVPPQVAQAGPVQMARGGIVAFAEGTKGAVDPEYEAAREQIETNDRIARAEEDDDAAMSEYIRLNREAEAAKRNVPKYVSQLEQEDELIKKYPERFAPLKEPVGIAALKRLEDFQALQRAEIEKQREEAARMKPSTLQMLAQAAARSRRGVSNKEGLLSILGGYGEVSSAEQAKDIERERGLRGRELELQQVRMTALDKIDEIKRARADGDLQRELKAKQEFAKLLRDHNVSANTLLGRQITSAASLTGRLGAAREAAQAKRDTTGKGGRTSDLQALAQATTNYQLDPTPENKAKLDGLRAAFRQSKPEFAGVDAIAQDLIKEGVPPTQAYAVAVAQYRAAGAGVTSQGANVKAAREAVRKEKILDPEGWAAKVKRYGSEQAAEDAEVDAYLERATSAPFKPNLPQNSAPRGTAANPIKLQ